MCSATRDLAAPPYFEVAVDGEISMQKNKQVAYAKVVPCHRCCSFINKYLLAIAPTVPFFDVEFADDTARISRNSEHLQCLLHLVQREAAKYNLHLSLGKCELILYHGDCHLLH